MRSLLFSVSLVICLSLTGQDYKPLVIQGNSWSEVNWSWGWAWTNYYFLEGDTTIDDMLYTKVYLSPDSTLQNDVEYYCGIREDIINKEVYCFFDSNMGEILLYRFGMDIGDSAMVTSMACESIYMIVTDTDTITDLMGNERQRMLMDHWFDWYDEYWIEGIGSSLGLLTAGNFSCVADFNQELLCFSNSNTLHYVNPLYGTCYITEVGLADYERASEAIRIIPNPVSGTSIVELESDENILEVKVYDPNGHMITNLSSSDPVIQRNQFSPGMFIIRVITENGKIYTSKFIVK